MTRGPFSGPSSIAASRRPPSPLLIVVRAVAVMGLAIGLTALAGPVVGDHGLRFADFLQLLAGRRTRNARGLRRVGGGGCIGSGTVVLGHWCFSMKSTMKKHRRSPIVTPEPSTALVSTSVTAQVAPSRKLLTRDSAYESTYP